MRPTKFPGPRCGGTATSRGRPVLFSTARPLRKVKWCRPSRSFTSHASGKARKDPRSPSRAAPPPPPPPLACRRSVKQQDAPSLATERPETGASEASANLTERVMATQSSEALVPRPESSDLRHTSASGDPPPATPASAPKSSSAKARELPAPTARKRRGPPPRSAEAPPTEAPGRRRRRAPWFAGAAEETREKLSDSPVSLWKTKGVSSWPASEGSSASSRLPRHPPPSASPPSVAPGAAPFEANRGELWGEARASLCAVLRLVFFGIFWRSPSICRASSVTVTFTSSVVEARTTTSPRESRRDLLLAVAARGAGPGPPL
mmetsp:Transcript_31873/g.71757  ORF Transcript_31873/g.71757 Transcript_31873/m.71757 type:complete len:321 (-) Transcript_31873:19-981(-)